MGPYTRFAEGVTSEATITATGVLNGDEVRRAVALLKANEIEPYPDGFYRAKIHPNAVFDTAAWTGEVLAARADHYGISVEDYRKGNVLKVEVKSRDVAELAAEMCGPLFAKTTGAQVPVDGGNDRVI